ncbi:MAG: AI-2E family transporter [Thermomicrobiales bacterium]
METRFSPRAKLITFWLLVAVALFGLAHFFHILSPFLWAMVTAYLFQPAINGLSRRTHLPRGFVAVVVYLVVVGAFVASVITLWPIVREQVRELVNQTPQTIEAATEAFEQRYPDLAARVGLDSTAIQKQISDTIAQMTTRAPKTALTFVQRVMNLLIEFFVYLIATFFFFLHGDRIVAGLRDRLPKRYHREINRVIGEINTTLGAYIRGQLLLVIIMSSTTYIALRIFDIRYAVALALMTGLLELVPIVGPWSAGTIAVSVAAFSPTPPFGWSHTTLMIAIGLTYFALRQLEDNLVIPTLIGRIVHLHPLLMIFVLLIGTKLGGILGLLLAVPVAAVFRILLRYVYGKFTAETKRLVLLLDEPAKVQGVMNKLPTLTNEQVVLLIQPGVLRWDDVPTVHWLATTAARDGVDLSVVTTDPIAGSLATAVGLTTTIVPATDWDRRRADVTLEPVAELRS